MLRAILEALGRLFHHGFEPPLGWRFEPPLDRRFLPPTDPFAHVRIPVRKGPSGRFSAVALAEPPEAVDVRVVGSELERF